MAYTLSDFYAQATQPLKKGIFDVFRKESFIMDKLPWETAGTLSVEYLRNKTLPTITARNIGESMTASKGVLEPMEEQVCILSAYIDIPKEYVEAKNTVQDIRAVQTKMFSQAMAYKFNDMFINGNPVTNVKEMVGIRHRLINDLAAGQSVDGEGLDISTDTATTTWYNQLIDKIEDLMSLFVDGKPDALLMNRTSKLRLESALRQSGTLDSTKDNYERKQTTWGAGGPAIIDIGLKGDQSTNIILNTELNDGTAVTGGTETSIYAVKFGDEFLKGFQRKELEAEDVGLLEDRITYRSVIDWDPGIMLVSPRSVARIYGIQAS